MSKRNGPTKAQKVEQFDALQAESYLYQMMVSDLASDRVVWGKWFSDAGTDVGKHRAGISRINGACGGMVIMTWRYPGQNDSVHVYHLENRLADLYNMRVMSEHWEAPLRAVLDAKSKALSYIESERVA